LVSSRIKAESGFAAGFLMIDLVPFLLACSALLPRAVEKVTLFLGARCVASLTCVTLIAGTFDAC